MFRGNNALLISPRHLYGGQGGDSLEVELLCRCWYREMRVSGVVIPLAQRRAHYSDPRAGSVALQPLSHGWFLADNFCRLLRFCVRQRTVRLLLQVR